MDELAGVAFGADPGRWPLPVATTPRGRWLRAVAAGGQGRYASALTDLDALERMGVTTSLASLAASTRASFLRQLGGHALARGVDGRAWVLAGNDVDAASDALIGLAADALGTGRFALSNRLLRRAAGLLGGTDRTGGSASGRLPVRLAWVEAELAMATGDGVAAVAHAERGVALAADLGSARHDVKSRVVLAAALCSVGDLAASRHRADDAFAAAERLGLIPLRWALACLLAGIGSAVLEPPELIAIRDESAEAVRHRGGTWTAR